MDNAQATRVSRRRLADAGLKVDRRFDTAHAGLLRSSYHRWTGRSLLPASTAEQDLAQALFDADFALVSHGIEADPVFNYGNAIALRLFEMDWAAFTQLPSRLSAEPISQAARDALMEKVMAQGFVDDYRGTRVSASGRRFVIEQATIWNLVDDEDHYHGQAAKFDYWTYV